MTRTIVYITTQFEGFHRWLSAPDDVAFLRDWHRHIFYVKVGVEVVHKDRAIEFFQFKGKINNYIQKCFEGHHFDWSCEMIAANIFEAFDVSFVEVSEDGENGAIVERI